MKDYKIILANQLKLLMKSEDLNPKKLAEKAGLPRSSVYDWVKAEREINLNALVKLADFFGVTTDELLGREE